MCVQFPEPIAKSPPGFWLIRCVRSALCAIFDWHLAVWTEINKTESKYKSMSKIELSLTSRKSRKRGFGDREYFLSCPCTCSLLYYPFLKAAESTVFSLENKANTAILAEACRALKPSPICKCAARGVWTPPVILSPSSRRPLNVAWICEKSEFFGLHPVWQLNSLVLLNISIHLLWLRPAPASIFGRR